MTRSRVGLAMRSVLLCFLCACGSSPSPPATVVLASSTPAPDSADAIRAKELVYESAAWTRVTLEAYEKSTLCLAVGQVRSALQSTHRPGEMFHTYVSPDGVTAYRDGGELPIGAAVSKRAFDPATGATTAYFLMWKEASSKWTYATVSREGTVLRAGALGDCAGCHDKHRAHDFLFRKI